MTSYPLPLPQGHRSVCFRPRSRLMHPENTEHWRTMLMKYISHPSNLKATEINRPPVENTSLPFPPIYVKYVRTHPDMKSFALKLSYPGLENVTYIFILNISVHRSILLAINISYVHMKVKWQKNRKVSVFFHKSVRFRFTSKKPNFGSVFRFTEQH